MDAYDEREEELGNELMRALERFMLLQIIDERWREHLHDMDYLREGIHLRSFAQIDPLVAYKNEGFEMFTGLMNAIWEEFARYVFNVEVTVEGQERAAPGQLGDGRQQPPLRPATSPTTAATPRPAAQRSPRPPGRPRRRWPSPRARRCCCRSRSRPAGSTSTRSIGRNDPCWCGSGKKFKKCHGQ